MVTTTSRRKRDRLSWIGVLGCTFVLALAARPAGAVELRFFSPRLTVNTQLEYHLEFQGLLFGQNLTAEEAQASFDNEEWRHNGTGNRQTTLTRAFLHDPNDPASPTLGPDLWQFNLGLRIKDFDYNSDDAAITGYEGVDRARLFLLGSHVDGPDEPPHDPNTLPEVSNVGGKSHANDGRPLRLLTSRGRVPHSAPDPKKRFDRYSARAEFTVDQTGQVFGILDTPGGLNVVIDAAHVNHANKPIALGPTFGSTLASAVFFDDELIVFADGLDIISSNFTTTPTIDGQYSGDSFTGADGTSFSFMLTGSNETHYQFTATSELFLQDFDVVDGGFEVLMETLLLEIDKATGLAQALVTRVDYVDSESGPMSDFLDDFFAEHLLGGGGGDRMGVMLQFDASALIAATNGFQQSTEDVIPLPFVFTGAQVPEPSSGFLLAAGLACLVLLRRWVGPYCASAAGSGRAHGVCEGEDE